MPHPLPAGPSSPAILQTLRFGLRSYEFAAECAQRYGDAYTLRILGIGPMVVFSDPRAVRDIFALGSGEGEGMLGAILGPQTLFELEGDHHLRTRRLMMPAFHRERMHLYGRLMCDAADRAIDAWKPGMPLKMHGELQSIALDVILHAVFGFGQPEPLRAALLRFLSVFDSRMASLVMLPAAQVDLGPFSPWGRLRRCVSEIDSMLFKEIARRRREGDIGREDILSMLIFARDEDGNGLPDDELRDQMFTLLLAGHETTATAMSWVLYRTLRRPDVVDRIRLELEEVVGTARLGPEHVGKLDYLDAVIKETLRLHPVIPEVGRALSSPACIDGVELPAGVMATASIYLTQRRPELWPDPDEFDPERFVDFRPSPYAYFPFGGGVRRCIGAAFATYEMKMVLARIFSRAKLTIDPHYQARVVRRAIACTPSDGMPVVVH